MVAYRRRRGSAGLSVVSALLMLVFGYVAWAAWPAFTHWKEMGKDVEALAEANRNTRISVDHHVGAFVGNMYRKHGISLRRSDVYCTRKDGEAQVRVKMPLKITAPGLNISKSISVTYTASAALH